MIKTKDGYARLVGTTYLGSNIQILLSNGEIIEYSSSSKANTLVLRNASLYIYATYFNSAISDETLTDIGSVYVRNTSDSFIRRVSKSQFYSIIDGKFVTLDTALIITGNKTFTTPINNSYTTYTHLAGNLGKALINSTASAGSYVMLFKGNSNNGYFTHGVYLGKYLLQYTNKSTVEEESNTVTKSVTLLDESGNSSFSGIVSGTILESRVTKGTKPLNINSTTLVTNLNADLLDDWHLIDIKKNVGYSWDAKYRINNWSRILNIHSYSNILLSINFSQNSLASNHLYLISTGYGTGNIVLLGANNFSSNSNIKIRLTLNEDSVSFNVEIYSSYGYNGATEISIRCNYLKLDGLSTVTTYTSYIAGGGTVKKEIISSHNKIVANLLGVSDSAIKLLTSRTLWGQLFDGTANVSGILSNCNGLATSWSDVWSDGENNHPWYGYDHRYPNTGVYSTTISDYYGMCLKTSKGLLSITESGNVGIGTSSPSYKLHVNGNTYTTGYVSGNTLISRVATGTAPLTVTSTTKVNNLNADLLDGYHATGTNGSVLRKSGYLTSGTAGLSSYWGKVASFTWVERYNDLDITLYMHSAYNSVRGIVHIKARWNSSTSYNVNCLIVAGNLVASNLRLYYNPSSYSSTLELWYNVGRLWGVINTSVISETERTSTEKFRVTLYNTSFSTVQTPSLSSYVSGSYIHLYNSVDVANKLGITTIGGSTTPIYLSSGTPKTCSVSSEGTASTIAVRDSSGDLKCRLVRPTYNNQSTISGALAFRVNNSSDNYIRFCSDKAAIRTWLGVAPSSHTHPLSQISDLHASWNAILKAAPSAYVTRWPSWSEVTNKPTSFTPSSHTHNYIVSRGTLNPQTGRTQSLGDVYSYNTSSGNTGAPTIYTSVIGFGRGTSGTVEIAGGWTSGMGLWYRSLRDYRDDWYSWRRVWDSGNFDPSNYAPSSHTHYWANILVSSNSSTSTTPTFGSINVGNSTEARIKANNYTIIRQNGTTSKNLILSAIGGTMHFRPNGDGETLGAMTLNTAGLLNVGNYVLATGFKKDDSSNSYVLLGGGSHKSLTDFAKGDAGSSTLGVYVSSGVVHAMTYSLKSTVNSGSTGFLAYYSNATTIVDYDKSVGGMNTPIYFHYGIPTECTGLLITYYAKYSVSGGTFTKKCGNYNFITSSGRKDKGDYYMYVQYPIGYNQDDIFIFSQGRLNANTSNSGIYVTIGIESGNKYYIKLADDDSLNDGACHIMFICFS